jgi:hypothetical protein
MNATQVTKASMAELVKFYNDKAVVPVKKFADRKSAERRVLALIAELGEMKKEAAPKKARAVAVDRSSAIAASWTKPGVREARAARHSVKVDGQDYRSELAAFQALGLNVNKHTKFRAELKASGKAVFEGRKFVAVARVAQ